MPVLLDMNCAHFGFRGANLVYRARQTYQKEKPAGHRDRAQETRCSLPGC